MKSSDGFWCDQLPSEWVVVFQGETELEFAKGRRQHLRAGYCLLTAPCEKHRVYWTLPDVETVWLAVFFD